MYDEKWLNELKYRTDIVDIIGEFVSLKSYGSNYWASCPFHPDSKPSFSVDKDKKFYYCFSCKRSGDAITFLMDYKKLNYTDAIEYLAKKANMEIPEEEYVSPEAKKIKEKRMKAYDCAKAAAKFYYQNLANSTGGPAIEYVEKRGFSRETLINFGIGYSPNFDSLPKFLEKQGYSIETMRDAGLLNRKNGDFLNGRIIIPIIDHKGRVIAFGGRRIAGESKFGDKYLNTADSVIFSKRNSIYNLNLARHFAKNGNDNIVILVEGYMDVISLTQAGIGNVIASMGTSLTINQCKLIKQYYDNVYVCYDGDAAGTQATIRSLELLAETGLETKVMSLPEDLDPDDYVNKYGPDSFLNMMSKARSVNDFKIDLVKKKYEINSLNDKEIFINKALEVISQFDSIAQEIYLDDIAQYADIDRNVLKDVLQKISLQPQANKNFNQNVSNESSARISAPLFNVSDAKNERLIYAGRLVLWALYRKICDEPSELLCNDCFLNEEQQKIFEYYKKYGKTEGFNVNNIYIDPTVLAEAQAIMPFGADLSEKQFSLANYQENEAMLIINMAQNKVKESIDKRNMTDDPVQKAKYNDDYRYWYDISFQCNKKINK